MPGAVIDNGKTTKRIKSTDFMLKPSAGCTGVARLMDDTLDLHRDKMNYFAYLVMTTDLYSWYPGQISNELCKMQNRNTC
jgi:hypothetical protein